MVHEGHIKILCDAVIRGNTDQSTFAVEEEMSEVMLSGLQQHDFWMIFDGKTMLFKVRHCRWIGKK